MFKHWTKELFVSQANSSLVGIVITIGRVVAKKIVSWLRFSLSWSPLSAFFGIFCGKPGTKFFFPNLSQRLECGPMGGAAVGKCRKQECVFCIFQMFSDSSRVLPQCNTYMAYLKPSSFTNSDLANKVGAQIYLIILLGFCSSATNGSCCLGPVIFAIALSKRLT